MLRLLDERLGLEVGELGPPCSRDLILRASAAAMTRQSPAEMKQLSKLPAERATSISETRPITKPPMPQALKRTP